MRYGLLALSIAMLTGGGVAAQSALTISHSADTAVSATPRGARGTEGIAYGSLPFTATRAPSLQLTAR